jgi:putative endonuclease
VTRGRLERGRRGEDLAAAWYLARGYEILDRNWRVAGGELDIVAASDGVLVFCEVKARSSDRFGTPAEAVGPLKQRRLRELATRYLAAWPSERRRPGRIRFDVAAVSGDAVEVIEAAF